MPSPREAAEQARVYRSRHRRRPRERWLRIVALAGSLFVHLALLLGVVLGPAYVPAEPPDRPVEALQVRFIPKKQETPPPPPPVRGTPPKVKGPLHRARPHARVAVARARAQASTPDLPDIPALAQVPVPTLQPPVIDAELHPAVPAPSKVTAAPVPPVSLPTPAPTPAPDLQPVPLTGQPPTVTLEAPPVSKPVPPAFQPEVPRVPRPEGNRPVPPVPSLAMPELPAQSPPKVAPPTLAMDIRSAPSDTPASVVVTPAQPAAAPPVPELQPVPLPAQQAPTVDLQPQLAPKVPVVVERQPQVQAPAVQVAPAPQLEAVPVAPIAPSLLEKPTQPTLEVPALARPAARVQVAVERAQPSPAETPPATDTPTPTDSEEKVTAPPRADAESSKNAAAAEVTAPSTPSTAEAQATDDAAPTRDRSSAPDATPEGSDNAPPGKPGGVEQPSLRIGKDGSILLPAPGQGQAPGAAAGHDGAGSPSGNSDHGELGSYIQLKPHGDTEIMSHRTPNIGYKATRFEQDWAPEGESALDTALRHAVEKTTVQHTFHLPRGVRIKCVAMPLFPMAMFACGNGDKPAEPVDPEVYKRLYLPEPAIAPAPPPAASAPAPVAPITLDNRVQCANARVAGGPLPPGCEAPTKNVLLPAPGSSSWVPASDQF